MASFPQPGRALPPAAAVSAYRDALLRHAAPDELAKIAASLDPEVVPLLDLIRAAQQEPMRPDPAFVARLDRVIASAPRPKAARLETASLPPLRLARSHAANGRHPSGDLPEAGPRQGRFDFRLALGFLATAAMLALVLVAGLMVFGPLRPQSQRAILGAPQAPGHLEFLWTSEGGPDPLVNAYGVGIDPQGNVWVSDAKDRFQIFAPDGTYLETWGSEGSGEGEFEFTSSKASVARGYGDVAFDATGNIFVADTGNSRIQKFSPDRTFLLAWGSQGKENGQFRAPNSIAVGPDGTVYVGDDARADIQKFDGEGRYLGTIGKYGLGDGQFSMPSGVAVDANDQLLVADYGNSRIQRLTIAGEFLDVWGKNGTDDGEFNKPNDVSVDDMGRVYVADDFNNRVQVLTEDGRFLAKAGGFGSAPGQLNDPLGLAAGKNSVVYVSDNDSIQAFRFVTDGP